MAITSRCAKLLNGQNTVCEKQNRRYFQQVVLINKDDIEDYEITRTDFDAENPVCEYSVTFTLKEGETGHRFTGPETGSGYYGSVEKSLSDLGFVQFTHHANMVIMGASERSKCILDALSRAGVVAAYQFSDGTVEIYGIENGLTAQDFTYDVQGGGGGSAIVLSSNELSPEDYLPLIYKSSTPGSESEDFDSNFANIPNT